MGKDKKKEPAAPAQTNTQKQMTQQSGDDPRGRAQNAQNYQTTRYENQQGPAVNAMARNYGQGATQGMGDYTNVMNQYNKLLGNKQQQAQPQPQSPVGNFDQSSYNPRDPNSVSAFLKYMQSQPGVNPSVINDPDYWTNKMLADTNAGGLGPDASYVMGKMMAPEGPPAGSMGGGGMMNPLSQQNFEAASRGYQNFADTGGYSSADMANLRARGTAPIRAAYENAQRDMSRHVNLQGGYSPNFNAASAKMARDQGQSMSDTLQGIEGGIVNSRNQNQMAGLGGLSQVGSAAGGLGLGYDSLNQQGQLGALQGMTSLYGATPGMASTFGNQLANMVNQGGDYGIAQQQIGIQGQKQPGQFDTSVDKIGKVTDLIGTGANAAYPWLNNIKKKKPTGYTPNTTQSNADIMGGD